VVPAFKNFAHPPLPFFFDDFFFSNNLLKSIELAFAVNNLAPHMANGTEH
jgi:hypothetical protein